LEKLVSGGTFDNLTNVIFNSLLVYGGFIVQEISSKLICFCSNGVDFFLCVHNGVTTQICKQTIPFMLAIHCIAHWINLIIQILSNQPQVQKLKRFFIPHTHISPLHLKGTLIKASLLSC
jgi:hypothetical protein